MENNSSQSGPRKHARRQSLVASPEASHSTVLTEKDKTMPTQHLKPQAAFPWRRLALAKDKEGTFAYLELCFDGVLARKDDDSNVRVSLARARR